MGQLWVERCQSAAGFVVCHPDFQTRCSDSRIPLWLATRCLKTTREVLSKKGRYESRVKLNPEAVKIFPEWGKGVGRVLWWYQTVMGKADGVASEIADREGSEMKMRTEGCQRLALIPQRLEYRVPTCIHALM